MMVRDHFQDIIPPESGKPEAMRPPHPLPRGELDAGGDDKSIRNINITRRAPSPLPPMRGPRTSVPRRWLWIIAGLSVLVLAVLAILFVFRQTSVTVVPHSQSVVLDQTGKFTAYPAASASGTLTYSTQSMDAQDSEPVAATGTEHQETKASGSVMVYNSYSSAPVHLIKNTRFESASGLVFRTPAAISIPGKSGSAPGKVSVTVIADAAGAQYDIGPGVHLDVPGLKSNAAMYAGVYAATEASTTGGFSGDVPAASSAAVSAARATIEGRIAQKAHQFAMSQMPAGVPLDPLITYTDLPTTQAGGETASVNESAHIVVPVIPTGALASALAQLVTAEAGGIEYSLVPGSGFSAVETDQSAVPGVDPLTFVLHGSATLVAQIDTGALASALAGRDSAAFQSIIGNFPGVDSAHARIEPFWQSSFPKNPADIRVVVQQPAGAGSSS